MENENASKTANTASNYRLPSNLTMQHITKLGIVQDKPIMLDYWTKSLDNSIIIGIREGGEKLLVKSEDEYTSPISKIYKVETDYIIETENSLYLTDANISTKRIS
tara:strand:+ start:6375 stop:6692 length:318 start_codon:yes stop_codon:yes gene_type:complete